jgi:SAM-dependent methyltransferase
MTSQDAVIDPVSITRALRGVYSTRLLCAAVCHLKVFEHAVDGSHTLESLQAELGLAERPANVLLPALRAMDLLKLEDDCVVVTDAGRYLCEREPCHLINYIGGEANDPGVLEMVERLRHDGLPGETGISFVKDDAAPSPMDDPEVARAMPSAEHLLDVACGSGFFAFEWLRLNPAARATLLDTSEVLAVAREFSAEYGDVVDRIDFLPADMLVDPLPGADLILAGSLFHDWPTGTCADLMHRFADALHPDGQLFIHDVYLNDSMDGSLPATDYSAQLFQHTKGRLYSRAEYESWMTASGLEPTDHHTSTQLEYALIAGRKPE